jgi:hypothetical protein
MKSHSEYRDLLVLSAAGALEPQDAALMEEHLLQCEECRRELGVLRLYADTFGKIHAPPLPSGLLERTVLRVQSEALLQEELPVPGWLLGLLALFSWIAALAFWWIFRMATSGVWRVFGANLADAFTWSAVSTLLVWATAGVVAVLLGSSRQETRNVL